MATLGFSRADFEVFSIEGFDARTTKIYELSRPRLIRLGNELAPELSRKLRMEFFPHVGKHVRRAVNPPDETWVALGPSPQGYKRFGFLALGISSVGIHARAVVKPQADSRPEIGRQIKAKKAQLEKSFSGTWIQDYNGWDYRALPERMVASEEFFEGLGEELAKKTGGIDVGFGWKAAQVHRLDRNEVIDAFGELEPLYRVIRSAV